MFYANLLNRKAHPISLILLVQSVFAVFKNKLTLSVSISVEQLIN